MVDRGGGCGEEIGDGWDEEYDWRFATSCTRWFYGWDHENNDVLEGGYFECDYEPWDLLGGGLKDENDDAEEEIFLDNVVLVEHATRFWLEDQLVHVLELNGEGIKIEVDFLQRNT